MTSQSPTIFQARAVNNIILIIYSTRIVSNKTGMSKILFSLCHRVWVWMRKKFHKLIGYEYG
jgi:hypothetical protein